MKYCSLGKYLGDVTDGMLVRGEDRLIFWFSVQGRDRRRTNGCETQ